MATRRYQSMNARWDVNRRSFLKATSLVGAGLVLGTPNLMADTDDKGEERSKPATNIKDALAVPRTPLSLPGKFPGKVVEIHDPKAMVEDKPQAEVVKAMFDKGITNLTGKSMSESFSLFFGPNDVIGIKINPVGAGLISTRLEVVDAIIAWLENNGVKRNSIVIWDRFDYSVLDAGFTSERYPGIVLDGMQTMDESAAAGRTADNSRWLNPNGTHVSSDRFDMDMFYFADVDGPKDSQYLNQHVFNGKHSYFGKLVTQKLTKIINVPVFKNTGNGISMATKNLGYGAICNTGRLHQPLFFDVCTEVLAFPCLRDKVVLNITDGLRGQYDGGPMPAASFVYPYNRLFFATDPFASDMVCHKIMVQKRKDMGIKVNEHPMFTEYLHYGERLGLGVVDTAKVQHLKA